MQRFFFATLLTGATPYLIINTVMSDHFFIAKVYRQHSSLVIALPKPVCIAASVKAGDYMIFTWDQKSGHFTVKKFIPAGEKEHGNTSSRNKGHKSR